MGMVAKWTINTANPIGSGANTGTCESLALLLGSVAENTVYTRTKVPMISAANPVPVL